MADGGVLKQLPATSYLRGREDDSRDTSRKVVLRTAEKASGTMSALPSHNTCWTNTKCVFNYSLA